MIRSHGSVIKPLAAAAATFDFVFSNRTASDEQALAIRGELTSRGMRVWQQRANIPKDSVNWFSEWYPNATQARKIVCFLTVDYMKSPFCMKEWCVAESKDKLLVVVLESLDEIKALNPSEYPHASNALAYLDGGGQVIFHDQDDVVSEILKFAGVEVAQPDDSQPEPMLVTTLAEPAAPVPPQPAQQPPEPGPLGGEPAAASLPDSQLPPAAGASGDSESTPPRDGCCASAEVCTVSPVTRRDSRTAQPIVPGRLHSLVLVPQEMLNRRLLEATRFYNTGTSCLGPSSEKLAEAMELLGLTEEEQTRLKEQGGATSAAAVFSFSDWTKLDIDVMARRQEKLVRDEREKHAAIEARNAAKRQEHADTKRKCAQSLIAGTKAGDVGLSIQGRAKLAHIASVTELKELRSSQVPGLTILDQRALDTFIQTLEVQSDVSDQQVVVSEFVPGSLAAEAEKAHTRKLNAAREAAAGEAEMERGWLWERDNPCQAVSLVCLHWALLASSQVCMYAGARRWDAAWVAVGVAVGLASYLVLGYMGYMGYLGYMALETIAPFALCIWIACDEAPSDFNGDSVDIGDFDGSLLLLGLGSSTFTLLIEAFVAASECALSGRRVTLLVGGSNGEGLEEGLLPRAFVTTEAREVTEAKSKLEAARRCRVRASVVRASILSRALPCDHSLSTTHLFSLPRVLPRLERLGGIQYSCWGCVCFYSRARDSARCCC
eukprot:COSAG01_NODE_20_length_38868_cov_34.606071_7_plen_719_part_00